MTKRRTQSRTSTRARVPKGSAQARTEQRAAAAAAKAQARTAKAQARFLREFAVCGNVLRAAQAAKVGRRTVYEWRQVDEPASTFRALYDQAHEDALDALEEEARRRAVDGVLEPVFQGGERVGSIRKYSDTLLITLLKGKRPETFRERFEHTGKNGGPIENEHVIKNAKTSLLEKLARLADRAETAPAGQDPA